MQEAHKTSFELFEILNLIYFIYFNIIFFLLKILQYDKLQHLHIKALLCCFYFAYKSHNIKFEILKKSS